MDLKEYDQLPDGILECPASALHQVLDGPALIHLEGRQPNPLFVSVLQHGNEVTGWEAVRRLLKSHYLNEPLPRSLSLFVGNVAAARHRLRRLDDQLDYNRCWPGGKHEDSEPGRLFRQVRDRMRGLSPIAAIDIHNNTGLNPHYAAINRIRPDYLRLASLFSYKVVYFTMPRGTLSHAFSEFCPSVTLECGLAGDVHGTDHSMGFLETCLHLDHIDHSPLDPDAVHLFHMVATVQIADDVLFGFGDVPAEVIFPEQLDSLNFSELPPGAQIGKLSNGLDRPINAVDTHGNDVTDQWFRFDRGFVETVREMMPSMLTTDRRVIQQDCLCYLMERIHFEDHIRIPEGDPLPEGIRRTDRPGEPDHQPQ